MFEKLLVLWFKDIRPEYVDGFGLIVTKEINGIPGDGGDTPQREGMVAFAGYLERVSFFERRLVHVWSLIRKSKGKYCRHPDDNSWTSKTNVFSRDQSISLVIALGAWKKKKELKEFFYAHLKRFGFYWNTRRNGQYPTLAEHLAKAPAWQNWNYSWKIPDFALPHHWGIYIRAFRKPWLSPFLFFSDFFLFINAIIITIHGKLDPDFALDDNFIMMMLQAKQWYPTPWIYLATKIYSYRLQPGRHKRPRNPSWNSAQAALYWEFKGHYPPIGLLYHDILADSFEYRH